ncbi:MAG: amidohydrolase family protein [Candidatus Binatia bacterium]
MAQLLVKNARVVATMDDARREIPDCDILIDGAVISRVGPRLEAPGAEVLDASGCVVLPGFVNTHNHSFQGIYRILPKTQDVHFLDWITYLTSLWIERPVSPEAAQAAARVNFAEMVLTGTTLSADQHYLYPPGQPPEFVDRAIAAAAEVGLRYQPSRGCLTLGRSRGGLVADESTQPEDVVLRHAEALIARYHDPRPLAMVRIDLAPVGIYADSEAIFRQMRALAAAHPGVRLATHIHEAVDVDFTLARYGVRPVEFLARVGWLAPDVVLYHVTHPPLTDAEITQLAASGAHVSHALASDLRLGWGLTRVRDLLDAGAHVCLGTTGPASNLGGDLLTEAQLVLLAHRVHALEPARWLTARETLWLATRAGARALGRDDLGSIEPGKGADLAVFAVETIDRAGHHDPVAALLFTGSSHFTRATIVNGRVVARDGRLLCFDQERAVREANAWARRMAG